MLNVKKINYDEDSTGGCETCNYGSSYVNEIEITFEDETYTNIKVDQMYEHLLSESDYMQLIANSNDIQDFVLKLLEKVNRPAYQDLHFRVHVDYLTITINGKDLDIEKTWEEDKLIYSEVE